MAGFPIRNAQYLYLDAHEEEVFAARANGGSWRKVAKQFLTYPDTLGRWLKRTPDRRPAWDALDAIAAEAKAGESEEILDEAEAHAYLGISSPELTRLAIARSDLAKWHAGVLNRGRFGPPAAAGNVVLNVGTLHLTAVRDLNRNPPPPPAGLLPPVEDADFEIVEPTLEQLLGEG